MSNRHPGALNEHQVTALTKNTDPYLSCDDCFAQVDTTIEALLGDGTKMSREFTVHLSGCPACFDEAVALAELLAPGAGLSPEAAAAAVTAQVGAVEHA